MKMLLKGVDQNKFSNLTLNYSEANCAIGMYRNVFNRKFCGRSENPH